MQKGHFPIVICLRLGVRVGPCWLMNQAGAETLASISKGRPAGKRAEVNHRALSAGEEKGRHGLSSGTYSTQVYYTMKVITSTEITNHQLPAQWFLFHRPTTAWKKQPENTHHALMACRQHRALCMISTQTLSLRHLTVFTVGRRSTALVDKYMGKIQGHIYPLKCVPNRHVHHSEHSNLHFFPPIILRNSENIWLVILLSWLRLISSLPSYI